MAICSGARRGAWIGILCRSAFSEKHAPRRSQSLYSFGCTTRSMSVRETQCGANHSELRLVLFEQSIRRRETKHYSRSCCALHASHASIVLPTAHWRSGGAEEIARRSGRLSHGCSACSHL